MAGHDLDNLYIGTRARHNKCTQSVLFWSRLDTAMFLRLLGTLCTCQCSCSLVFSPMQAPYVARVHQFESTLCALLTLRACLIITHQYNRWYAGIQTLPKLCSLSPTPPFPPKKNPKKKILGCFFCI